MTADSGVAGDFVTNNGAAGRTVSGTLLGGAGADEKLRVSMDGGLHWLTPTVSGTGWSVTDPASHTSGWTIAAQAVDLAGNTGPLTTQIVTLDTTPPAAPSALDIAASSNSGVSATDHVTNVTKPVFTGATQAGAASPSMTARP